MKKFTLIIGMLVVGSMTFAQGLTNLQHRKSKMTDVTQNDEQKTTTRSYRAPGDIIFEEYFNASEWSAASEGGVAVPANMPAGWSVFDATGNNFFWRWSTEGPRGPYTSSPWNVPNSRIRIKSTSDNTPGGEQGFIMFELDFYNTTSEGGSTDIAMDSYIQLPPIETTENSAVNVRFEQYHRFCCASYEAGVGPKLYISSDNTTWTEFDVEQASINATPATNPSVYEMAVSNVAANETTVYVRLHIKALSHYYWQVDDFVMYEPEPYDARIMGYWVDYRDGKWGESYFEDGVLRPSWKKRFTGTPFYNPYYAFQKITTSRAIISNFGGLAFPNAQITTKIVKEDGTVLDEQVSNTVASIIPGTFDTSFVATHNFQIPKTIESVGSYYYDGLVSGSEEDLAPENNAYRYDFHITENVIGYADPKTAFSDRQSPFSYTTSVDGDGIGVIFYLDPPTENIPGTEVPAPFVLRGINTHINNDGYNWDIWRAGDFAYLTAVIYEGIPDGEGGFSYDLEAPVIQSAAVPIDSTTVNSWVFLPFITDGASENITPTEQGHEYLAMIRFTTGGLRFFVGADKMIQPTYNANILQIGGLAGGLGWTGMEANISMEVVIDKYMEDPRGEVKVQVLQKHKTSGEIRPIWSSPVELRVPIIDEDNEFAGIDFVTKSSNIDGYATFDNLRTGTYAVYAALPMEGGEGIQVDEEGYEIWKRTGVTVQGSGQYEVTITFDVDVFGIEEYDLLSGVKLYPVPSNNTVTVESPVSISRIVISNIVGQVVETIENPTQVQTISVADYATGVYMVTLFDNNGNSTTQRFIKQ